MLTDGVLDALPVGEQDFLLETIIKGTEIRNPKELARHILQQVLNWTGKEPEMICQFWLQLCGNAEVVIDIEVTVNV